MVLRCVSLFSGVGGLDLGVQQAGFKIVFASDMEQLCAEAHGVNFPKTDFLLTIHINNPATTGRRIPLAT